MMGGITYSSSCLLHQAPHLLGLPFLPLKLYWQLRSYRLYVLLKAWPLVLTDGSQSSPGM